MLNAQQVKFILFKFLLSHIETIKLEIILTQQNYFL